ncbi:hypothetical protein GCM10014715_32740 [Streptomyces spiralis]|uniref:Uncharacterized protein n=1 Tax=Streptomyces spiralis TaxID=66376 RepID=A0A918ZYA0_9ACTN|nr:hypothetical protein GCM10014715_32740 [Streptomyces spiralis]
MLRQLIHHLPATSPYGPRHLHVYAAPVQRLTTAPPRRHAPRFFLAGALVANPPTNRDVSPQIGPNAAAHRSLPAVETPVTARYDTAHLSSTAKDAP